MFDIEPRRQIWYTFPRKGKNEMAETLKIALRGFWRGFVDLGRGFDWSYTPPERKPQSIDRYFANVGGYLINARNRFERECLEIEHADA